MKDIIAGGGQARSIRCDVGSDAEQEAAFEAHIEAFHSLDVVCLNAGIMEVGNFLHDDSEAWKQTININLMSVVVGVRIAVRKLRSLQQAGSILVMASAGGIFPMPLAPMYSISKAGCIALVRTLGPRLLDRYGIYLNCLCPQFADTNLVRSVIDQKGHEFSKILLRGISKMLTADEVANVAASLLLEKTTSGQCIVLLADNSVLILGKNRLSPKKLELFPRLTNKGTASNSADNYLLPSPIPDEAQKIVVHDFSPDFIRATRVARYPVVRHPPPGTILVRNKYVGINASDVNFSSGLYQKMGAQPSDQKLPFDCGFEFCGICAATAPDVLNISVGEPVAAMLFGSFAEYILVPAKLAIRVPRIAPEIVALMTSGLTASIAIEHSARVQRGETVLITAAAGGTGQFFVQLSKAAGCHVIAVCGSEEKAKLLRQLGADRIINYRVEDIQSVLKSYYPSGVDVVFELVGGNMFDICLKSLGRKGRLIVIGAMSQYQQGWKPQVHAGIPERLLSKSASCIGFFLLHYSKYFKRHLSMLIESWQNKKLHVALDPVCQNFVGIEDIFRAVQHLQSGSSMGKVYVTLS